MKSSTLRDVAFLLQLAKLSIHQPVEDVDVGHNGR